MTTLHLHFPFILPIAVSIILLLSSSVAQAEKPGQNRSTQGINGTPHVLPFNINRMLAYYWDDGVQEERPSAAVNIGMAYPKGTAQAIFSSGILWGGKFSDGRTPLLRVNGQSAGFSGTLPGAILGMRTGTREDANAGGVRVYRIRKDFRKADLKQDAADTYLKTPSTITNADAARLKADYLKDWQEWPWQKGAPFDDSGFLASNGADIVGANNGMLDWGEDANRNAFLDAGEDVNSNGKLDGETPGIANADQVLWYVCSDVTNAIGNGARSGMELQFTIWGYNRNDELGNVIFKRYRLIYKGLSNTSANARIDSMYICQYTDIDLGDFSNDYAGCDTMLGLGFVYNNGPDRLYTPFGIAPPAIGNDFVQGPLVPGVAGQDRNHNGIDDAIDYGIVNFKRVGPGFLNLPLTAFEYDDRYVPRNTFRYQFPFIAQATAWYQVMRGVPPSPTGPPDPPQLRNPLTNQPSSFWSNGDPATGIGWLDDGIPLFPGDRTIASSSGPFTMALGDTQEVVVAVVGGLGNNNLASVKVMKFNDKIAQLAYNNFFNVPKAPQPPTLRLTAFDQRLILDWESDSTALAETENVILPGNYQFEGYNVYQMPNENADISMGKIIARYDLINGIRTISQEVFDDASGEVLLKPVQNGTDNGIHRSLLITKDSIMQRSLVNGQTYYFAVTAYNYTPDATNPIRTVESTPHIVIAVPETPRPGTRYTLGIGDTVSVTNVVGANDAVVIPIVYNPGVQTGDVYHVKFDTSATGSLLWSLNNSRTGKLIHSNISNLRGDTPYRVAESGFDVFVTAPPVGMRSVTDTDGNNVYGVESTNPVYQVFSLYRELKLLDGAIRNQRDYEIRFDGVGSYALQIRILAGQSEPVRVPFSVWDIGRNPADQPVQVIAAFKDSNNSLGRWNVTQTGVTYGGTLYKVFEPIYITSITYPSTNDSAGVVAQQTPVFVAVQNQTNPNSAVWAALIGDKDNDGLPPPAGTKIRFSKWHRIEQGDVKGVAPPKPVTGNIDLARKDVSRINVFPNPVYGRSLTPTGTTRKSVTFSHLPDKAIIRIFNLAGVLVRVIVKDDAQGSSQFLKWDLQNQSGLPIASGIYIAYIEMPELNSTKVLKIVVIQEEEYRRSF